MSRTQRLIIAFGISLAVNLVFWIAFGRELRLSSQNSATTHTVESLKPVELGLFHPLQLPKPPPTPQSSGSQPQNHASYSRSGLNAFGQTTAGLVSSGQGLSQAKSESLRGAEDASRLQAKSNQSGKQSASPIQSAQAGQVGSTVLSNGSKTLQGKRQSSCQAAQKAHPSIGQTIGASAKLAEAALKDAALGHPMPLTKDVSNESSAKDSLDQGSKDETDAKKQIAQKPTPSTQTVTLKMVKMWTPTPGQDLTLPNGLKVTLPQNMQMSPGRPLTDQQIDQLRKLLSRQRLEHVAMNRKQLQKLLMIRRTYESLKPPPAPKPPPPPPPPRHRHRRPAAPKPKPPHSSVHPAQQHQGQTAEAFPPSPRSPFLFRRWNPEMYDRWAPDQSAPAANQTAPQGAGHPAAQAGPSRAPANSASRHGTQMASAGSTEAHARSLGAAGPSGGASQPHSTSGAQPHVGGSAGGNQGQRLGSQGDNGGRSGASHNQQAVLGGGSTGSGGQNTGGDNTGGANSTGSQGGSSGQSHAGQSLGSEGSQGGGNTSSNQQSVLGSGNGQGGGSENSSGGQGGQGAGQSGDGKEHPQDGQGGVVGGSSQAGASGTAGQGAQNGQGAGDAAGQDKNTAAGDNAGQGSVLGGGGTGGGAGQGQNGTGDYSDNGEQVVASAGDAGTSNGEGGGGGGGEGAGLLSGEQSDGMADTSQSNHEDTGYPPAVGSAPDYPPEDPNAKNGIPGALVLPPSPPIGTSKGHEAVPRPVKVTQTRLANLESISTGRVATGKDRPARKLVRPPTGVVRPSAIKPILPALTVGSASSRGTVPVIILRRPFLPIGTVTDIVDPPLPPAKGTAHSRRLLLQKQALSPEHALQGQKSTADVAPQPALARLARNSHGVPDGSKQPLPPTLLPDRDEEVGDGSGLKGQYYMGRNFDQYLFTRADPNVDFDWGMSDSPSPRTPAGSDWSIRWTGKIEATYSETYTFYATADDGVRVWIDHKLIIDDWSLHPTTQFSNTLSMVGGEQYDIKVEYFESGGPPANVRLYWESPSQIKQYVPESAFFYPLPADEQDMRRDIAPGPSD